MELTFAQWLALEQQGRQVMQTYGIYFATVGFLYFAGSLLYGFINDGGPR